MIRANGEVIGPDRLADAILNDRDGRPVAGEERASSAVVASSRPNQCWQLDFTSWTLANGTNVVIANVIDETTRVCVASMAFSGDPVGVDAWEALVMGASQWGVPALILCHQENPFDSAVWTTNLETIGIGLDHSQARARVGRFHQTLKRHLASLPTVSTTTHLQVQLDEYAQFYNHVRPSQAIGRRTPASLFAELALGGLETITVSTNVVDWAGHVTMPGPYTVIVATRYAGAVAAAVREGTTTLMFIHGKLVGQFEVDAARRIHILRPLSERPMS